MKTEEVLLIETNINYQYGCENKKKSNLTIDNKIELFQGVSTIKSTKNIKSKNISRKIQIRCIFQNCMFFPFNISTSLAIILIVLLIVGNSLMVHTKSVGVRICRFVHRHFYV